MVFCCRGNRRAPKSGGAILGPLCNFGAISLFCFAPGLRRSLFLLTRPPRIPQCRPLRQRRSPSLDLALFRDGMVISFLHRSRRNRRYTALTLKISNCRFPFRLPTSLALSRRSGKLWGLGCPSIWYVL